MKLNTFKRVAGKKGDTNRIRQEGKIPAVFYVKGKPSEAIVVDAAEYDTILRSVKQGRLSTTKFTVVGEDGKERIALIKDVQYDIMSYDVIHLDFEELLDDVKVKVNVPIVCRGVLDCVGIKLGGSREQNKALTIYFHQLQLITLIYFKHPDL